MKELLFVRLRLHELQGSLFIKGGGSGVAPPLTDSHPTKRQSRRTTTGRPIQRQALQYLPDDTVRRACRVERAELEGRPEAMQHRCGRKQKMIQSPPAR